PLVSTQSYRPDGRLDGVMVERMGVLEMRFRLASRRGSDQLSHGERGFALRFFACPASLLAQPLCHGLGERCWRYESDPRLCGRDLSIARASDRLRRYADPG